MSADCVLDANILIRHFTQDDPWLSPRSTAFLLDVANGNATVLLPDFVVFETVFTLERTYKIRRDLIAEGVLAILELEHIVCAASELLQGVLALYVTYPALSFVDCYLVNIAQATGIMCVATFDKKVGSVPGIKRFEPPELPAD